MPTVTRTFRVFVSSTFEDLAEERNALQREVFPRLHDLCLAHGARFQAIDLRWGVRDEAAVDQRTMEICLTEIERCQKTGIKPNFIVLLGDRYGWRPLPARIEATGLRFLPANLARQPSGPVSPPAPAVSLPQWHCAMSDSARPWIGKPGVARHSLIREAGKKR